MKFEGIFRRIMNRFRISAKPSESSKADTKSQVKERIVWVVRGGKVYHLFFQCPSCQRSQKPLIKTTYAKARARGLRECGMCREIIDRAHRV